MKKPNLEECVPKKLDGKFVWEGRTRQETEIYRIAWNRCRKQFFINLNQNENKK